MFVKVCENCGSTHLVEEDGVLICKSCGSRYYDDNAIQYKNIEEKAKNEEIERLINVNKNTGEYTSDLEPRLGLLTDEEILKYAPNSYAAMEVKFKNAKSIKEKIKYNDTYQILLVFGSFIGLFIISILILWIMVG